MVDVNTECNEAQQARRQYCPGKRSDRPSHEGGKPLGRVETSAAAEVWRVSDAKAPTLSGA
ncbi:hypothetical protein GCM10023145_38850 [Angustibacter luteus]